MMWHPNHEGLKAAEHLISLFEGVVMEGRLKLDTDIAIVCKGVEISFTAEQYFALAKNALAQGIYFFGPQPLPVEPGSADAGAHEGGGK